MREIKVIVGKAKSGKSYLAYNTIKESIRKNNDVLTLDFYKDSNIFGDCIRIDPVFSIADMDFLIREFNKAENKSKYKIVIFDGFEQLINQVRKEISYVIPSNNYFDNSDFVSKYIKLKVYEWISSLLNRDIDITIISNLNCFDNSDDVSNFVSFFKIFEWGHYINAVKVRKYETYIETETNEVTDEIEKSEYWVRDCGSRDKKEENRLADDLIKELNEGK